MVRGAVMLSLSRSESCSTLPGVVRPRRLVLSAEILPPKHRGRGRTNARRARLAHSNEPAGAAGAQSLEALRGLVASLLSTLRLPPMDLRGVTLAGTIERLQTLISRALAVLVPLGLEALEGLTRVLPHVERALKYILMEAVLIPKVILGQLCALVALRSSLVVVNVVHSTWQAGVDRVTPHGRERLRLRRAMAQAKTFDAWKRSAKAVDRHALNHLWRQDRRCTLYDVDMVQRRIDELERLVAAKDTFGLIFRLRGGLGRGRHGLLHEKLYDHAFAGTKVQVQEYHRAVVKALEAICDDDEGGDLDNGGDKGDGIGGGKAPRLAAARSSSSTRDTPTPVARHSSMDDEDEDEATAQTVAQDADGSSSDFPEPSTAAAQPQPQEKEGGSSAQGRDDSPLMPLASVKASDDRTTHEEAIAMPGGLPMRRVSLASGASPKSSGSGSFDHGSSGSLNLDDDDEDDKNGDREGSRTSMRQVGNRRGNGYGNNGRDDGDGTDEPLPFSSREKIPTAVKLAFFNETRHAYGRTALLLSGGAALGFYHAGLLRVLLRERLLPRVISGSSAGAIMAAVLGTKTDAELRKVLVPSAPGMRFDMIRPNPKVRNHPLFRWASGVYNMSDGTYKPQWKGAAKSDASSAPFGWFLPRWLVASSGPGKAKEAPYWEGGSGGDEGGLDIRAGAAHASARERAREALWPPLVGMFLAGLATTPWAPFHALECDTDHLVAVVRENCGGDLTFQEAFDRTGRIINITVSPMNNTDRPRLLNYLTAPHVLVWSAATASSAVPGVFKPQQLLVKEMDGSVHRESLHGGYHSDGSLEADLPMAQLSELFDVNHFIVSQVNPHGVALSTLSTRVGTIGVSGLMRTGEFSRVHVAVSALVGFLQNQLRAWGVGLLKLIGRQRQGPKRDPLAGVAAVMTQNYEGRSGTDVTVLPWNGELSLLTSTLHTCDSPHPRDFARCLAVAERNTWPKLPRIHAHCDVEVALERCVQKLRQKVAREAQEAAEAVEASEAASEAACRECDEKDAQAMSLAQAQEAAAREADTEQSSQRFAFGGQKGAQSRPSYMPQQTTGLSPSEKSPSESPLVVPWQLGGVKAAGSEGQQRELASVAAALLLPTASATLVTLAGYSAIDRREAANMPSFEHGDDDADAHAHTGDDADEGVFVDEPHLGSPVKANRTAGRASLGVPSMAPSAQVAWRGSAPEEAASSVSLLPPVAASAVGSSGFEPSPRGKSMRKSGSLTRLEEAAGAQAAAAVAALGQPPSPRAQYLAQRAPGGFAGREVSRPPSLGPLVGPSSKPPAHGATAAAVAAVAAAAGGGGGGMVKTSSMASFYYSRDKSKSQTDLANAK